MLCWWEENGAQGSAHRVRLRKAGQQWTARAGGWLSVFQEGQEAGLLSCPDFSLPLGQVEGKDVCLWVCPRGPRMRCEERLVCVGTSLGGTLPRRFCAWLSGWCRRPTGSPPLLPALFLYVAGLPLPFKVTDRWAQGHKVSLGPLQTPTLNSSFYLCAENPANAVSSPGHSAGPREVLNRAQASPVCPVSSPLPPDPSSTPPHLSSLPDRKLVLSQVTPSPPAQPRLSPGTGGRQGF